MELLVVNPNTTERITALIGAEARAAAGPATRITAVNPTWGTPSIETHIDAHLAAVAMLDLLARIGPGDGVLVAAFSDPGLAAIREAVDVPVVGIGEAALGAAAQRGPFAVLTIQPASVPLIEHVLRLHGLAAECVAVRAADVSVVDAADPSRVRARLIAAGRDLVASTRVESLCLGGGPLGIHADAVAACLDVPVITAVTAGVRLLQKRVAARPRGNRSPVYELIDRKPFTGELPFLRGLDDLVWAAST